MRRNQQHFLWLGMSILAALTLAPALLGQASSSNSEAAGGLPTDWSHHHVIFSKPANPEQAYRLQHDPRYWQQQYRHSLKSPAVESGDRTSGIQSRLNVSRSTRKKALRRDWSQDMGSGATVGAGNYPAKYSFNITQANCTSDFAVYATGLPGSTGQASIAAFNNLYSGCGGTVPSVYWAYNTSFTVVTSPVFSRDGTQVAFVQRSASGAASLVLVKWAASTTDTIGTPTTLTRSTPLAYLTCTTPCRTSLSLLNSALTRDDDTLSSVFYDYSSDTAYVGDSAGFLHQFTPVFLGVLAEVRTGGWPVQVNSGSLTPALTSPVHDFATGNVFVADVGGFLYSVDPTGVVTTSGQLDFSALNDGGPGIVQGPVVDSTSGFVYVYAPSDGSQGCAVGATPFDCAGVFQLTTGFLGGDTGSEAVVGSSTVSGATPSPSPLYIGAFDSTYLNSVDASGNLYVCGNTGGDPVLYQVAITAGSFGTVNPGPVLSTTFTPTPACSPVTDILNPNVSGGATEWIFASTTNGGASSGCSSGGCIFNFRDTPWLASTTYAVGQEVLDSNFQIQVVSVAGTSGATAPIWSTTAGGLTPGDGTVVWLNQGVQSAFNPAWAPSHSYITGDRILDGNGNIQLVTIAGTSGGSSPTFSSTLGGITLDAPPLTWTNVGAIATAALAAAGGTSGIIIDNTVSSGTLAGTSQIYFSTLSNQICGSAVNPGGCAVQASQPGLQ
jgi:hypothetical protein